MSTQMRARMRGGARAAPVAHDLGVFMLTPGDISSVPFFGLPISCVGLAILWSIMVRGHLPLGLGSFGLPLSAGREVG